MVDYNPDMVVPGASREGFLGSIQRLYDGVFGALQRATDGWFIELGARFVFASVLLLYYLNSAFTKFEGLAIADGAYAQMFPKALEAVDYDSTALPFFYKIAALFGAYGELILPILIVIGLFSRIAAIGMIIFIVVQSVVDITGHGLGAEFIGAMFDAFQDGQIWDQRLLWVFPLAVIVFKGAGYLSVDHLIRRARS